MDEFEKHIRDNKDLFDGHKADRDKMWASISSQLEKPKTKVIPLWKSPLFKVAASIVLVFGLAFMADATFRTGYGAEDNIVSRELLEIDMHYQSLVASQVQLVKDHPELSNADKEEFLSFMDELDVEYKELKQEMGENLDNELVLEAIIGNYKKRIELIENLLRQIKDSKKINDEHGYVL